MSIFLNRKPLSGLIIEIPDVFYHQWAGRGEKSGALSEDGGAAVRFQVSGIEG
jgi:hypothetical protein